MLRHGTGGDMEEGRAVGRCDGISGSGARSASLEDRKQWGTRPWQHPFEDPTKEL